LITVRRANERLYDRRSTRETWLTFQRPASGDASHHGFRLLENLRECRLPPANLPRLTNGDGNSDGDGETITYVREGALTFEDSADCSRVLYAGEFRRASVGRGLGQAEANASPTAWAHAFQVSLAAAGSERHLPEEQKRFSAAERRGGLCVVASSDARKGSLRVAQDVVLYSALLDPGQHIVHQLLLGRSAWIHVVAGSVVVEGLVLATGDGAGIVDALAASTTAREASEILLLDLG
jgi:redox-sensitive bicupin YhaK (pirin superfamily)